MKLEIISLTLLFHVNKCFREVQSVSKSPKKGLVIPYWPMHKCGDFDAFSTISWWYNYHTTEKIYENNYKPHWCTCPDGKVPQNKSICFPSDPLVKFVPLIYGIEGYGSRPHPEYYQNPPLTPEMSTFLGFNEPNSPGQRYIPPDVAALEWKLLEDKYPDKVMISPAPAGLDTDWMDEFVENCEKLNCRIDYLATHVYKGKSVRERMEKLRAFSERYGKKLWLTEFSMEHEADENKIVEFVEEFLPQLEFSDFIHKYSWYYTRYYENHEDQGEFWLDSYNSLMDLDAPKLSKVGLAYDKPWHLEKYRPKQLF